ncbi:hypothetical protein [Pedobacter sp. SYP-B3415]|uniref:hypothetical protein n=1 Tax=Pedobacter sp. SYP-B3415 TaxID=2496641 RepID=UPI00101D4E9A|nr:hypothetical protein [Pedobacter sp. SYP-B3415]
MKKQFYLPYKQASTLFIAALLLFLGCRPAGKSESAASQKSAQTAVPGTNSRDENPSKQQTDTVPEVMDVKDIRFNGKLGRYFSSREFKSVLGAPDSTRLLSDEEPCVTIFQEPDGSVHPKARYLYKNGSRFETSRGKVAIDHVSFEKGDFIIFKNVRLDKHTTLVTLATIFPNATRKIAPIHVSGEGMLRVFQLIEDESHISDGHVEVFIKDGKLYSLHWWFPC